MYKVLIFLGAVLFLACEGKFLSPKVLKHRQLRQNPPPKQPPPPKDGPPSPPQGGTEGTPTEDGTAPPQGAPNGPTPPPQAGEAPEKGGIGTAQPPINEVQPAPGGGEIQPSPSAPGNESAEGGGEIEDDVGGPEEQVEPNWNGKGKPSCMRCITTILDTGEEYFSCAHNSTKCPKELAKETSHLKLDKLKPKHIEHQMIAFHDDTTTLDMYALSYNEDEIPESLAEPAVVLDPQVTRCANCTRQYISDKDKDPWTNVLTCTYLPLDRCPMRFSDGAMNFHYDILSVARVIDTHCLCLWGDPDKPNIIQDPLCVCGSEPFGSW